MPQDLIITKNYSKRSNMEKDIQKMSDDWEIINTILPSNIKTKKAANIFQYIFALINNLTGNSDWVEKSEGEYKVVYKKR